MSLISRHNPAANNMTREKLSQYRESILKIARSHGGLAVWVVGSVARNEATEKSDLDLVVRFEAGRSLLDHGSLIMDLRDLLGIDVDVISEAGIRLRWRDHLLKEAVAL